MTVYDLWLFSMHVNGLLTYRYLLNNPGVAEGKRVLDLGSGCGASAIAASLCGASHVVANDIDNGKAFKQ